MAPASPTALLIEVLEGNSAGSSFLLTETSTIGRDETCTVFLNDAQVSRQHLRVEPKSSHWLLTDLKSSNGTYLGRQPILQRAIEDGLTLRLGKMGPLLRFETQAPKGTRRSRQSISDAVKQAAKRYVDGPIHGDSGDFTRELHIAFRRSKARSLRLYQWAIALLTATSIILGIMTFRLSGLIEGWQSRASESFYDMKEAELRYSTTMAVDLKDDVLKIKLRKIIKQNRENYLSIIDKSGFYRSIESEEDKLIYRTAFELGECETQIPEGFLAEVKSHINTWQSRNFKTIINRARRSGYIEHIQASLDERGLPPHLLYIAMQESNFDTNAVGPETRFGRARGMWQFIDMTAQRFNLRLGTGDELSIEKPARGDDRHNFFLSTKAAMDYIEFLYRTDAKASGLLVMASYNWGERYVLKRLQTMPEDPRQRNFWALVNDYGNEIPDETYKYVYSIVAAAVIGQNPRLFGIDMDPVVEFKEH